MTLNSYKILKNFKGSLSVIVVTLLFLLMVFPLFWMFSCSIRPESEIFIRPPHLFPASPTLASYISQISSITFNVWKSFQNSFIISTATMILSVILSTGSAYGLARYNIRGKKLIIFLFLMSQMLPQVFTLVPNFIIFKNIGIFNTYFAPIMANATIAIPFCVLMMRTYFLSVPKEIDDAASIDGCNAFKSFLLIMLPISATGLVVSFVFSFLFGYGDMVYSLTYVTNSEMWPITTGIYNVVGRYGIEWSRAMAFGFLTAMPVLLIFIFMQKFIVQGLTSGAVKG